VTGAKLMAKKKYGDGEFHRDRQKFGTKAGGKKRGTQGGRGNKRTLRGMSTMKRTLAQGNDIPG